MQSVQRKFGKMMSKNPGDNTRVSVLLKDYEDADQVLAKVGDANITALHYETSVLTTNSPQIIEGTRAWRDSWLNLLNAQLGAATEYESLYDPIVGATDGHSRESAPTPEEQLRRTLRLKEVFSDLRAEMMEEISMIDSRLVKPANDARDCINPIRKTIKKRENKRLDYEKCQDKVNKLTRKLNKTPKEDSSLAKAEQEVMVLAEVRSWETGCESDLISLTCHRSSK
jgi:amphiphysin